MSAHHDEQQELENAKYLWNNGGKWLVVALVSIALIYWGKGIYRNYQLDKYAQAAAMATQVKGDVNKLAQLQKDFSGSAAAAPLRPFAWTLPSRGPVATSPELSSLLLLVGLRGQGSPSLRVSKQRGDGEGLTLFVISPFNPQMGQRLTLFGSGREKALTIICF